MVAEAVLRSALPRRESRGAHVRIDYPGTDAALGAVNNVVRRNGAALEVRSTPSKPLSPELRALMEERV
jgi:succinate dehydrogenase / fumarate reductase flavoprotein subunit